MSFIVRRIRADEALPFRETRLAALLDAPTAFSATYAETADRPMAHWHERVLAAADGPANAVFVATAGDVDWLGLVGGHRPGDDGVVELFSMWVRPDARRRDIGRHLVGAVVEWATDTDASAVELWVTTGNTAAIDLYRRCGFVTVPDVVAEDHDPCRAEDRMRLELDSAT